MEEFVRRIKMGSLSSLSHVEVIGELERQAASKGEFGRWSKGCYSVDGLCSVIGMLMENVEQIEVGVRRRLDKLIKLILEIWEESGVHDGVPMLTRWVSELRRLDEEDLEKDGYFCRSPPWYGEYDGGV